MEIPAKKEFVKRLKWYRPTSLLGAILREGRPEDEKVKKNAATLTFSGVLLYAGFEIWSVAKAVIMQEVERGTFTVGSVAQWIMVALLSIIATSAVIIVRKSGMREVWSELQKQQHFISNSIDNLAAELRQLLRELMLDHEVNFHGGRRDATQDPDT